LETSKEPYRKEIANQSRPMTSAALKSALDNTAGSIGLILSISHDDYHDSCGGVQNLIIDERNAFDRAGWRYLHISPASPLPTIATDAETFRVALRLDTKRLGVARFNDLANAIATLRHHYLRVELIVHHFMGHVPELLLKLAKRIGVCPIVWIHDFFSLCPSYALMRNDVSYCAAPAPGSAACGICVYGTDRIVHLHRIRNFFEASRPIVIAPSRGTLDFWEQRSELPCSEAIVLPLARLVMSQDRSLKVKGDRQRALRVAHLGGRTLHKGWHIFEELALRHRGDPRYKFYQLGVRPDWATDSNVQQISVRVESASRKAMIEAIAECRIDIVICWSLCRETFCYTVHEALSGGAFVVARRASGNVWPSIEKNAPNQGCAVENEAELFALFETGKVEGFAAERSRGVLIPGGGTADLLLQRSSDHNHPRLNWLGANE
jgi:hypothetical protein